MTEMPMGGTMCRIVRVGLNSRVYHLGNDESRSTQCGASHGGKRLVLPVTPAGLQVKHSLCLRCFPSGKLEY